VGGLPLVSDEETLGSQGVIGVSWLELGAVLGKGWGRDFLVLAAGWKDLAERGKGGVGFLVIYFLVLRNSLID
jgi:hypothetical protein